MHSLWQFLAERSTVGGYVIRNLNISMKAYSYAQGSTTCLVGFFGYSSGVIENVTLAEDCAVRVTATGSQYLNVGSICGVLGGNYIANCHNRAYIEVRSLFGNIFATHIIRFIIAPMRMMLSDFRLGALCVSRGWWQLMRR